MAELNDRSVSIGRIFSRTFGVMGSNPGVVFGVAFVLGAGPQLIYNVLIGRNVTTVDETGVTALAAGLLFFLVNLISGSLASGCITRATVAYSQGRRASLGDCLSIALARFVPVIVVSILFAVAVMLGSLLLLVPGIIAAVMWSVVIPVTVEENTGIFGAFGRSRMLTRGARWKIFGLFVLLIVIGLAIGIAGVLLSIGMFGFSYKTPGMTLAPASIVMSMIVSTLAAALNSALQTALFVELREWKDGPLDAKLSDIFA